MNWMKYQSRQENMSYLVLWATLFVAPVLSMYIHSVSDSHYTFQWGDLWMIWPKFLVYLLLFLVHNFLLAPILVFQHKRWHYTLLTLSIVALFTVYQCTTKPQRHHGPHHMEQRFEHPVEQRVERPMEQRYERPKPPPAIIGEHDIMAVVVLVLMFGMNLGVKGYFKSRQEEKQREATAKENLEHQLEYLKYQLNPHFLMNTLNNIHMLIDIEPTKAQQAVIQLSKILRYVLYESDKPRVLLSQEIAFVDNYVELMRLRYTDHLRFTANKPQDCGSASVPPLLFISFVENAFKHGVSYQEESFIDIHGERYHDEKDGERLRWTCRNSKHATTDGTAIPKEGGIGMVNVRRRLDLIFQDRYRLDIHETENAYEVVLDIPLVA